MKKKNLIELKNKSSQELKTMSNDLQKKLTEIRFELKLGKLKNVHEANLKRREHAQVLTFLKLKELSEEANKVKNKSKNLTKIKEETQDGKN